VPFPLYFDDDVESRALARGLMERGFDVLRATDAGMRGQPDAEHLAFATSAGRVLYTANRVTIFASTRIGFPGGVTMLESSS
jgi:hypothetical protein